MNKILGGSLVVDSCWCYIVIDEMLSDTAWSIWAVIFTYSLSAPQCMISLRYLFLQIAQPSEIVLISKRRGMVVLCSLFRSQR